MLGRRAVSAPSWIALLLILLADLASLPVAYVAPSSVQHGESPSLSTMASPAHASGVVQPLESSIDEFLFFTITLEVKDSSDSPIAGAQVLAFSDDWGIRIPGTLDPSTFLDTGPSGHATFRVPRGTWTFFAFHGELGKCYFLTASVHVQSSTKISLKPSSTFFISPYSVLGDSIDIDEFRIVDESHAPIVPTSSCGTTAAGQISVAVNSPGPFRIVAVRRPSFFEGYYLMVTGVTPSQNLAIRPTSASTASATFRAFGTDNSPTAGNVEVRLPDFDINNMVVDFSFTKAATVVFTPMPVVFNFRFLPNGWYLYFSGEAYQLSSGSSLEIKFGGPLTKQLQVIPHASTGQGGSPTFAPKTQIWLKISDQFGHILQFMSAPSGNPAFPFSLTEAGNTIYQNTIPQGDPFVLSISQEYSDSDPPDFQLTGDLGPFGPFSLSGPLISPDTTYQIDTSSSAHFRMAIPAGFGARTQRNKEFMDRLYDVAQDMTGEPIHGDIQYEVDIQGGGFSWESLRVPTKVLLVVQIGMDPLYPPSLFFAAHEFGHTRTLRDPTRIALDFWGESYATLVATEGISRFTGPKMWLWSTGQHDFFFYHLQGRPVSDRSQQIETSQFVLAYLENKFGWDIHHLFFSQWSSDISTKAQILFDNDFEASETYATLYSYLADENLAWIFEAAGLGVTDGRVAQGLSLITGRSPPSLDLFSPQIDGLTVTVNGAALAGTPGTSITRINWDWGDGISVDAWFPASHTYNQAGTYTVTTTAFQSDGLLTSRSLEIQIKAVIATGKPTYITLTYIMMAAIGAAAVIVIAFVLSMKRRKAPVVRTLA